MRFRLFVITVLCFLIASCGKEKMSNDVIASNDDFTVTGDSVIQGHFVAYAPSRTEIISNYRDKNVTSPMSPMPYRLAFNMRDNELPAGSFHIGKVTGDTIFATACVADSVTAINQDTIPPNTTCTLKVDLRAMTDAFDRNGVFVTATGDSIFSDEFNGVWVIGNVAPLTWDLKPLASNNRAKLRPSKDRGFYELDLTLNPTSYQQDHEFSHWQTDVPNPDFPTYTSADLLVDAIYNMSVDAVSHANMASLTTGQASLAIFLSLAHIQPDVCEQILRAKVHNGVVMQDVNTRFASPIVNDRFLWAAAAWKVYCASGNKKWLKYAFQVIENSVNSEKDIIFCDNLWLIHGCDNFSSPESQYPRWMQAKDYYESMKLSTNVAYAYAYYVLGEMADELNLDSTSYENTYNRIKDSINQNMWNENLGRYCSYMIDEAYPTQSATTCNLAQSMAMLFDIADDGRATTLLQETPFYNLGIPSTYPAQITSLPRSILPYLQAMWTISAARNGNENAMRRSMAALMRAAAFYGFQNNRFTKGEQALNASGTAAIVTQALMGIALKSNGLEINPFIPVCFPGKKSLKNFRYRNASFDITIVGAGTAIKSVTLDKKKYPSNFFPSHLSGHHTIEIAMETGPDKDQGINLAVAQSRPFTPSVHWSAHNDSATIENFQKGLVYAVVINGKRFAGIHQQFAISTPSSPFSVAYVVAKDHNSDSYISTPHYIMADGACTTIPLHLFAESGTTLYRGASAEKMVEFSATKNAVITIRFEVKQAGEYYLDMNYSNGARTSSNCPMCQVVANTHKQDIFVMPQRGLNEWRNFGFSNMIHINLLEGKNSIQLQFIRSANSANDIALLNYLRLIKK